jgi:hypothetical protein
VCATGLNEFIRFNSSYITRVACKDLHLSLRASMGIKVPNLDGSPFLTSSSCILDLLRFLGSHQLISDPRLWITKRCENFGILVIENERRAHALDLIPVICGMI